MRAIRKRNIPAGMKMQSMPAGMADMEKRNTPENMKI